MAYDKQEGYHPQKKNEGIKRKIHSNSEKWQTIQDLSQGKEFYPGEKPFMTDIWRSTKIKIANCTT